MWFPPAEQQHQQLATMTEARASTTSRVTPVWCDAFQDHTVGFSSVKQEAEGPLSVGPSVRLWFLAAGVHGSWALLTGGGLAAVSWPAGSGPCYNLICRPMEGSSLRRTRRPSSLAGEWLRQWGELLGPAETDTRNNLCVFVEPTQEGTGNLAPGKHLLHGYFRPQNPWRMTGG